jgi:hypothetical protein
VFERAGDVLDGSNRIDVLLKVLRVPPLPLPVTMPFLFL